MTATAASDAPSSRGHRLRVAGAVKRYGQVTALHDVGLDIAAGRFLVLLGPSGSGKSTLARLLAGVEKLTDGTIRLGDTLVADGRSHLPPERRDLAMVFQDYALWPHLTAAGNVAYALRRRRLPTAEARRRTHAALERVGLGAHADRYPHELSGGEQQRVALARAVVAEPGLLLFDEPLSNLDADLRERLRVEIATLTRECGATAVYITHDQSEAFALADEIAVLDRGRLVQLATPETVYRRPATPFVARFTGLAGELPGSLATASDQVATVRVAGRTVTGRLTGDAGPEEAVSLLVRPAATHLLPARPGDADTAGDGLPGTVLDLAYRGRGYDHVIVTPAGTLTSVFDQHPYARGTAVTVSLDPDGCFVFPAKPEPVGLVSVPDLRSPPPGPSSSPLRVPA
ncbi:ABC transporter ATP-binding protein [Frankia sp. AgB1.9]|uniref:ABC transporter ATP-binding protein n=1 Tax=unclassified Frankia TaxID=2632575 RepID=UPI001934077A|nr:MULTISPECIES: ABC transporter ATP-binding protein [unclassified Frankia]MBL7488585.1 ABC transporter ATP-binding protein [Frankia sp. AgW1.1]MBL7551437.1 ABC transporter ATP-binding protein [Frankia sp. AgB1.9]MBL7619788.1 ABC transporter ATP-binding protein [Frankia sp. AgB1.8]